MKSLAATACGLRAALTNDGATVLLAREHDDKFVHLHRFCRDPDLREIRTVRSLREWIEANALAIRAALAELEAS